MRLFFGLIFTCSFFLSFGQEIITTHFTENDGLPSRVVYSCFQDKKGYIWFGTNLGVARYDGIQWENYAYEDQMSDIDVFQIFEDPFGRIWFLCGNGSLSYFNYASNEITAVGHNLSELSEAAFFRGFKYYHGSYFWGSNLTGIVQLNASGRIYNHKKESCHPFVSYFFVFEDTLYAVSRGCILEYNEPKNTFKSILNIETSNVVECVFDDEKLYLGSGNMVFTYDMRLKKKVDSLVLPTETSVLSLNINAEGNLLIGTVDGFYIDAIRLNQFDGNKVTQIITDHEGSNWITTLNNGVYFMGANQSFIYKNKKESKVDLVNFRLDWADKLATIGDYKTISLTDSVWDNVESVTPRDFYFADCIRNNDTLFPGRLSFNIAEQRKLISARMIQKVGDTIYHCRYSGLYRSVIGRDLENFSRDLLHKGNVNSFLVDDTGKIWIGDNLGLWLMDGRKIMHLIPNVRITRIRLHTGHIFVATRGKGFYIYKGANLLKRITQSDGLPDSFGLNTYKSPNGQIWLMTSTGISQLTPYGNSAKLNPLTIMNTAVESGIKDVFIANKRHLWLDKDDHVLRINYPIADSSFPADVMIKSVAVNENYIELSALTDLSYNENNVRIALSGLTYRSKPYFTYRVLGGYGRWQTTLNPVVKLVNLAPGDYVFEAYAWSAQGIRSKDKVTFEIGIHPPFWQSYWFYGLMFLIFALLVYLFFKIRVLTYNRDVVRDILLSFSKKIKREQYILVKNVSNGAQTKILLTHLIRVKGAKNYVELITVDERILVKMTMAKILLELNKEAVNFYRVHQSHIIHIEHVKGVHGDFIMLEEDEVPIGRAFKKEAQKMKQRLFS